MSGRDVERRPDWQTATLARVDASRHAYEGARKLARALVAGVEAEGIPAARVWVTTDRAVELVWAFKSAAVTLTVYSAVAYSLAVAGCGEPVRADVEGEAVRKLGWSPLRTALMWADGRAVPKHWDQAA